MLGIDDEDDSTFTISCDQKTFHFQGIVKNVDRYNFWTAYEIFLASIFILKILKNSLNKYQNVAILARDAEEREKWIGALENTVMKHSHSGLRVYFRYNAFVRGDFCNIFAQIEYCTYVY